MNSTKTTYRITNPFEQLFAEIRSLKSEIVELKESSKEDLSQKLYTKKEASILLKVSEQTVSNYIKEGIIKAETIGRRVRIYHYELFNSLEEVKSLKYKR
ncbi:excisionase family DNA binding protein [Dokdonia sp. Hel_I_63]|uniref:helix-turn-helix domain-containing protein n=1 Tax=Dokdonia sp. Hel_I_63 TaxID=1249996 RepID=UPI00119AEB42|nr:helix-turn-helix domain-containing protein [Dokdonia sp. Hel_I_63]TVZ23752.1 excisionase family DNA binding protein [Dokdonia sp. Hel_I_63]